MARILYVEDETFLGKIVKESLESRGFEVQMVTDGLSVMDAFRSFQPDLCVLDVMLPGRDGFELARDIRSLDPKVPILFLTARTQTEDVVKGFTLGGNDYLKKPFSMEELIVRMQNLLQLSGQQAAAAPGETDELTIGAFRYQPLRQVLTGPGGERKLSYREAELLRYLYEHRHELIDRRDLLNALWGNDNFFNSRNLDVYVTRLRGYLRDDPSIEILTIKGFGYRFVTG